MPTPACPHACLVGVHAVTVPGACSAWVDTVEAFGTMSIADVLAPATAMAREGWPVAPVVAALWDKGKDLLSNGPYGDELLLDGRPPAAGEIMSNPTLADTFDAVAAEGKAGFYSGRVAEAMVDVLGSLGGTMTLEDLVRFLRPRRGGGHQKVVG